MLQNVLRWVTSGVGRVAFNGAQCRREVAQRPAACQGTGGSAASSFHEGGYLPVRTLGAKVVR